MSARTTRNSVTRAVPHLFTSLSIKCPCPEGQIRSLRCAAEGTFGIQIKGRRLGRFGAREWRQPPFSSPLFISFLIFL